MERIYIRDHFKNGSKMNQQIADLFIQLRATKDTKTLDLIKTKMATILNQFSSKITLSS